MTKLNRETNERWTRRGRGVPYEAEGGGEVRAGALGTGETTAAVGLHPATNATGGGKLYGAVGTARGRTARRWYPNCCAELCR